MQTNQMSPQINMVSYREELLDASSNHIFRANHLISIPNRVSCNSSRLLKEFFTIFQLGPLANKMSSS